MAEIINLRTARKAKARQEAEARAAEQRIRHGQTRIQRDREKAAADKIRRILDGAKLDDEQDKPLKP